MSTSITERVAEILTTDEDIYVPVKKLWVLLQAEGMATELDLEAFSQMLQADDRFEFNEGIDFGEGDPEEEAEMEALGFFSGPRAKLKAREITREDIARILERKTQNILDALRAAWDVRPPGDEEAEDQLLELLASAQRLQRETLEALEKEE
jgi:hypothetical protein